MAILSNFQSIKVKKRKLFEQVINFSFHISGVGHTEDLGYLFDFGNKGSSADYLVRDRYVRLITNFAKYRNPTPRNDNLLQNVHWPANIGKGDIKQLNITTKLESVTDPYKNNMDFWENIFEKQGVPPFDTF